MKQTYTIVLNYGEPKEVTGDVQVLSWMSDNPIGIRKEGKYWVADDIKSGRSYGLTCEKKADLISKVAEITSDSSKVRIIKNEMTVEQTVERYNYFTSKVKEFHDLTGIDLPIHPAFGLDVIELNDMLGVPDDKSVEEVLTQKYGKQALKIVKDILNTKIAYAKEWNAFDYFIRKNW